MNHLQRAVSAYGQAAQTLPPARQIVLLYDGALRRLREAREALVGGRVQERWRAVQRAAAIVDALHGSLDFERGGEIAPLLDRFYTYVAFRLQRINLDLDPLICDELAERLGEMRAAWAAIAEGAAAPGGGIGDGARPQRPAPPPPPGPGTTVTI
ncbi:MAG TPA: flagellar export chaperone FliS [Geminicoccaceae bacterium]|nr:flagellar export chaperone FliS [Geminicoccaceae bacterium]